MSTKKLIWTRPSHAAGCLLIAFLLWCSNGLAQEHVLERNSEGATLRLDLPVQVKYSILVLHKPNRLVIELDGPVDSQALDKMVSQFARNDPDISAARVEHPTPSTSNLVFVFRQLVPAIDAITEPLGRGNQRVLLKWSSLQAPVDHADATLLATQPAKVAPARPPLARGDGYIELLLMVEVNRQPFSEPALLLSDKDGNLYAPADEIKRWRLLPPALKPVRHQGGEYFSLKDYAGLQCSFNQAQQSVAIMAEAKLFPPSAVPVPLRQPPKPTPSRLGGFLNYDLVGTHSAGVEQRSGQFEVGVFNGAGVCTSGLIAPELGKGLIRLDTTCTSDSPANRQSWRFGDIASRAGSTGGAVRMGGVQFGTNFGTQPGFISFPVQQAAGVASLPSAVDVYVNNVLTSRREVPPGPFSITNLPVVSGNGEVRLVVRDMLGREQVISQPFYTSAGLLAAGLHDYSYELGFQRENFGSHSNDYGDWAAAATHRKGFSENFTAEAHVESTSQLKTFGLNGLYLIPQLGIVNASLAGSQSGGAKGQLAALGFERQDQSVSYALRSQWTNSEYQVLGQLPGQPSPARQNSMNLGYSMKERGSLGFSILRRDVRDQPSTAVSTASYNLSSRRSGTLMVSLVRSSGGETNTRLSLIWAMPLGANRSASVTQNMSRSNTLGRSNELTGTLEKILPVGAGEAYRIEARDSGNMRGAYTYQNNLGTYGVEGERVDGENATRVSVRGGMGWLGGEAFFSRWIDGSFGLARVPGFANVRVYADNHLVGQTSASGNAMVPHLHAYERNQIRIEARDLPINAQVDALRLEAVPYYRSGVLIDFPVRRARGALFRVRLESGEALPLGSSVQIRDGNQVFPVAFNGEVFVTGLAASNRMIARWQNKACGFELNYTETDEAVPDLGAYTCKEISP